MFSLVRLSGPKKGESIVLDGPLVRLGRARGNEVRFDRERERVVSNCHAEIRLEGEHLFLYDLQSSHGTFLNEQQVTRARLQEGDVIGLGAQLGGPTLRFTRQLLEGARPIAATQAQGRVLDVPGFDSTVDNRGGPGSTAAQHGRSMPGMASTVQPAPEPASRSLPGGTVPGVPVGLSGQSEAPSASRPQRPHLSTGAPGAQSDQGTGPPRLETRPTIPQQGFANRSNVSSAPHVTAATSSLPHQDVASRSTASSWLEESWLPPLPETSATANSSHRSGPAGVPPHAPLPGSSPPAPTSPEASQRPGLRQRLKAALSRWSRREDDEIRPRNTVEEYRRQQAAREVLRGQRPSADQAEIDVLPAYPRRFVLEEELKERSRPEWVWVSQHRWWVLSFFLAATLSWVMIDDMAVWWASGKASGAVIVGRPVDAGLIDPPGASNPELVRQVKELQQQVRALPPQKLLSGDPTLRALRFIVREAGDDSEFIPIDFSREVDAEARRLKAQRGLEFIYARSLKYRPELVRSLEAAGLPAIMSYIPWLESEFSPEFSDGRAGRAGLWGMTADVARRHGLVVTTKRDDRRDWRLQTAAACSYLTELVGELRGTSFSVAAPFYRSGPRAVRAMLASKEVWKAEELSVWSLYREGVFSAEQTGYLVRLMAVAVIVQEPSRFGLPLAGEER